MLETVKGSSDAYKNDKLQKMGAAVMCFDGEYYIPMDTVLECGGIAWMTVEDCRLLYRS